MSSLATRPTLPVAEPAARQRLANLTIRYLEREIVVPPSAHTLSGFRAWAVSDGFPSRGRISFLDGELFIDMSPEELSVHNKIKTEVTRVLANLDQDQDLGEFFSDRALLTNEAVGLSTEPDASFATWETEEAGRLTQVPLVNDPLRYKELQGTPDWVLEIVSDSSVQKDTQRLRILYHRAGIPEYWLIDARGDDLDFRILVRGETDYEPAETRRAGWQVSIVFKRQFRLTRKRGRMNKWRYKLEMKPLR